MSDTFYIESAESDRAIVEQIAKSGAFQSPAANGTILYGEAFSDLRAALLQTRQTEARLEARGCTDVEPRFE